MHVPVVGLTSANVADFNDEMINKYLNESDERYLYFDWTNEVSSFFNKNPQYFKIVPDAYWNHLLISINTEIDINFQLITRKEKPLLEKYKELIENISINCILTDKSISLIKTIKDKIKDINPLSDEQLLKIFNEKK